MCLICDEVRKSVKRSVQQRRNKSWGADFYSHVSLFYKLMAKCLPALQCHIIDSIKNKLNKIDFFQHQIEELLPKNVKSE